MPAGDTWRRDIDRAGIEWEIDGERANPKGLRRTFESHLLCSGADLTITSLLMRHTPAGGLALTLGVYSDTGEIARRKRTAIDRMTAWITEQRRAEVTATG